MITRISKWLFVTTMVMLLSGCIHIYQSLGHNHGAFIAKVSGKPYEPVANRWDYKNKALLYIYRPNSEWAADEIEAPSFYIDGERVFNIRANGYTWFELEPGQYEIIMRRPLMGLEGIENFDLKRIAELNLKVEADHVYYLRYSEIDPPKLEDQVMENDLPVGDGPLVMVKPELAHADMLATRMLPEGARFVRNTAPLTEDQLEDVFDSRVIAPQEDDNTMKWWW